MEVIKNAKGAEFLFYCTMRQKPSPVCITAFRLKSRALSRGFDEMVVGR